MLTSFLAAFTVLAGVQALLVIKLADFLTEGADARGAQPVGVDARGAGIA